MMGVRGRRSGECRTDGQSIQDTNGPSNCMIIEIWNEDWAQLATGALTLYFWMEFRWTCWISSHFSQRSIGGTIRNGMAPLWSKSTDVVQLWVQFMAILRLRAEENCYVIEVQNDWSIYRTYRLWSFKSHEQIIVFFLTAITTCIVCVGGSEPTAGQDNNRCIQFCGVVVEVVNVVSVMSCMYEWIERREWMDGFDGQSSLLATYLPESMDGWIDWINASQRIGDMVGTWWAV